MADFSGRPNPWATIAKLVAVLVAAGVIVAGFVLPYIGSAGLAAGNEATKFQNTTCNLTETPPPQRTTLLARDKKTVIATLFSQDRQPVALKEIPQSLQDALVATEDRRFYSHHGVDLRGLIRSAVSTSGGDTQGGSTLTMQYVKQEFYFQAGNDTAKQDAAIATTLDRKMLDAKCALDIESKESKADILDNYLNIAFFGENAYGIETAAETYFNKHASQLTLNESAMLVGLLRAPTTYDPFLNRAASTDRRNQVLQNLVDVGKLSEAQAQKLAAEPIALATNAPPQVKQGCANANKKVANAAFFCEYAVDWLKTVSGLTDTQLNTGGLSIVTTLDPKIQNSTQTQIAKSVPATSPVTAVLPSIDPRTGDVLAMAASKTFGAGKGQTEQPIFTKDVAQGASTYKLFPLLAALQIGVPSDWPLLTQGNTGTYKAHNCPAYGKGPSNGDANEQYSPTETLASATAKSSNTFYVGLADQLLSCNLQPMLNIAQKLGMNSLNQRDGSSKLTIAQNIANLQQAQRFVLGSVETSPLEIAGAYAAVANHGSFNAPAPVISITDELGHSLPTKRVASVQAVSPQAANEAVKILEGDTLTADSGTSAAVFATKWYGKNDSRIAGKTGTAQAVPTSKNGAIWFVGMTPTLVASSALINFDNPSAPGPVLPGVKKAGSAYGDYASKIWLQALEPTLVGQKWKWQSPSNVSGDSVPDIAGKDLSTATSMLKDEGFKIAQLDPSGQTQCADKDNTNSGTVAYFGPNIAPKGSTITVCLAGPVGQDHYIPPKIIPKKTKSKTPASGARTGGAGPTGRARVTTPPRHR